MNIAWRHAPDIPHEADGYLCERTPPNYRRRFIELDLDEALFRTLSDQLIKRVGVDASKQRLDLTTVKSATRGPARLGIVVEAASKLLRELRCRRPEPYTEVQAPARTGKSPHVDAARLLETSDCRLQGDGRLAMGDFARD
ncbi:hypothetical protein Pla175_26590 [Pirellulimonas nuda]|uniref:Uncharacterized protein n=1 Tax=Pirellulimonas nuda TaxID=2528009 RepID=A0A518DCR8_9BACT|nr:hypothetical protein [Pirellulimonas nuda]QDU89271.1 hypothetical protein Pla175_26590 [Pirellulimonas nuda]